MKKRKIKVVEYNVKTHKVQVVSMMSPEEPIPEERPVPALATRTYLLCKTILQAHNNLSKLNQKTGVTASMDTKFCQSFINWYEKKFGKHTITSSDWM